MNKNIAIEKIERAVLHLEEAIHQKSPTVLAVASIEQLDVLNYVCCMFNVDFLGRYSGKNNGDPGIAKIVLD